MATRGGAARAGGRPGLGPFAVWTGWATGSVRAVRFRMSNCVGLRVELGRAGLRGGVEPVSAWKWVTGWAHSDDPS